jgi:hypothetical protein
MAETEKMNSLRIEKLTMLNEYAKKLEFENYACLFDELRALRLSYLESMMAPFMENSRSTYMSLVQDHLEKNGIPLSEARRCDQSRLQRPDEFDPCFDREHLLSHLESTLTDLGISLSRQAGITVDMDDRTQKTPRPFVVPLRIPDDIRIVISPIGGYTSYRHLFHETGHAQHYAHIDPTIPFTYRLLGDASIEEGFAFLLENLLYNEHWLSKHFEGLNMGPFLAFASEMRLSFLRAFAIKVSYEKRLFALNDMSAAGNLYQELFTKGMGFKYDSRNFLADVDSAFKCGIYLRGWIFEGQISDCLERNFGKEWFCIPEAGAFLKQLWEKGMTLTAEEIVQELGYSDLDVEVLEHRINRMVDYAK